MAMHVGGLEGSSLVVSARYPALGGATPREAVDDPTRRGDLIRLLDTFDTYPSGPGSMNVNRLRGALGLDLPE